MSTVLSGILWLSADLLEQPNFHEITASAECVELDSADIIVSLLNPIFVLKSAMMLEIKRPQKTCNEFHTANSPPGNECDEGDQSRFLGVFLPSPGLGLGFGLGLG